ncbi:MAG TPA: DUF3568 family protein [Thermoanaerobaculia bacterium]|nr:DUF3568 family protein [Thermoanaerobaculia bacterium]HUM29537.1 DUF3568 family protein [Thermoanaerobaculia bacterium]HXK67920.1 DUF3568 family protein [Thermoanaerobaculia bacterium]
MKSIVTLALLSALLTSCAAAVVGVIGVTGGYLFVNGQLKETVPAPLPAVHAAVKSSFIALGFHETREVADKLKGKLQAEMADGTRIYIWLKATDMDQTEVSIRVGYMGDRELSIQILKQIKSRL